MYSRHEPFLTVSHHFRDHPNWRVYLNATYRFVDGLRNLIGLKQEPFSEF